MGLDDGDPSSLRALLEIRARGSPTAWSIDDGSWADLDLDEVLAEIDRCPSMLGRLTLAEWLRTPVLDQGGLPRLEARRREGEALAASEAWARIRSRLERMPMLPQHLVEVLWGDGELPTLGALPTVLTVAALTAPLLALLISTQSALMAAFAMFAVNTAYHFWASVRVNASAAASLDSADALLAVAGRIACAPIAGLEATTRRIAELSAVLRPLAKALAVARVPQMVDDFPAEYLRILLLTRERRLTRSAQLIHRHRAELRELIDRIGSLEAAWSAHGFRASRETCSPELDPRAVTLSVSGCRHPLLAGAVPNELQLDGGLVVLGSNMSGKSTFLRTVALNALLAQSLGFACAQRYRGPLLRIRTALRAQDHLAEGHSTFHAEALRIRTLLAPADHGARTLCLLDEPFRGTNSAERIAAGVAVLRHLAREGALVIAATHDVELPSLLPDGYRCAHFADADANGSGKCDYRLRAGPSMARNALKVLASLGYPAAVVAEANAVLARDAEATRP